MLRHKRAAMIFRKQQTTKCVNKEKRDRRLAMVSLMGRETETQVNEQTIWLTPRTRRVQTLTIIMGGEPKQMLWEFAVRKKKKKGRQRKEKGNHAASGPNLARLTLRIDISSNHEERGGSMTSTMDPK